MRRRRPDPFEPGLADLVAACESGVDLAGVLEAARRAASAAAGGAEVSAYAIADDGTNLRLAGGPGTEELPIPAKPEPRHAGDAWVVPLISARRTVGCLVVRAPAGRLVAGLAPLRVGSESGLGKARLGQHRLALRRENVVHKGLRHCWVL